MKPTLEEVRALQKGTGDSVQWCKQVLEQKYASEEKEEMLSRLTEMDLEHNMFMILNYLIRKA